jgi:glycosyltransferase involved in cell wall biosynthesis
MNVKPRTLQVSVVIPCFNAASTLVRAVASCIIQREVAQIIIVDDRSSDKSLKLARKLARHDSRIKVVQTAENGGAARARNAGAKYATRPVLAFLDADDEYLPHAFSKAVECLLDHPEHHVVRLNVEFAGYPADIAGHDKFAELAAYMNNVVTSGLVVRRAVFEVFGGFPLSEVYRRCGGEDAAFQLAASNIFGFVALSLSGPKQVRNHYHANSHAARYFYLKIRNQRSPAEVFESLTKADDMFIARARRAWDEHTREISGPAPDHR